MSLSKLECEPRAQQPRNIFLITCMHFPASAVMSIFFFFFFKIT